jgi:signal transduction histidine kinase
MGSFVAMRVEASQAWFESVWSAWTLPRKFTFVGLVALTCGALLSAGWMVSASTKQVLIGLAILVMVNILLTIASLSSEMTAIHRGAARAREMEQARLLEQNADLQRQVDESQRRLVEIHDMVLRRVGVELHDGPAQLISLALLRLEGLLPEETAPEGERPYNDFERIRGALQEALTEIRSMSAGLTLPELTSVSPGDVLRLAVRNHERWTATSVICEVEGLPQRVPALIKSCLYRFAQEALSNGYRHGGGRDQTVRGRYFGDTIQVEVTDAGPGFDPNDSIVGGHLGLLGMRERIASAGGTLEIESRRGSGTRLTARFNVAGYNSA